MSMEFIDKFLVVETRGYESIEQINETWEGMRDKFVTHKPLYDTVGEAEERIYTMLECFHKRSTFIIQKIQVSSKEYKNEE